MKKRLKKSNKGFSLVELIVVIAIMAVLIGVIAPAFLRYVQKSKDSADASNCDTIRRAAIAVLADPTLTTTTGGELYVNGSYSSNTIDGNFKERLDESFTDDYPEAKQNGKCFKIVVTVDKDTHEFKVEVTLVDKPAE
ncbi:MAG: type II secretion system protein [bacterium]|nr:type II secretion system protein [bacterium]